MLEQPQRLRELAYYPAALTLRGRSPVAGLQQRQPWLDKIRPAQQRAMPMRPKAAVADVLRQYLRRPARHPHKLPSVVGTSEPARPAASQRVSSSGGASVIGFFLREDIPGAPITHVLQCFCYNTSVGRRVSYFWALHADPTTRLSDSASDGLEYATRLAEDAKLRAEHVLEHRPLFEPLTIGELAELYGVTPATVRRRIALARKELFGELTDSGIWYRLRRKRQLAERPDQFCQQRGCDNRIPREASAARKYCDKHRTAAARISRHRENRHPRQG